MSVRLPFQPVQPPQNSVLPPYWQHCGFCRPRMDVYLVNRHGDAHALSAQIDTASDYTILTPGPAIALGEPDPYRRQVQVATASGSTSFSMPDDGAFALYLTDYRSYFYFLPAPPLGIWPGGACRSVLGLTGFLQYFEFHIHNDGIHRPEFELTACPNFPGTHGVFAPTGGLFDHIRDLRLNS